MKIKLICDIMGDCGFVSALNEKGEIISEYNMRRRVARERGVPIGTVHALFVPKRSYDGGGSTTNEYNIFIDGRGKTSWDQYEWAI